MCEPLISKIHKRLAGWKSSTLSYAGRLELKKSVLNAFLWTAAFQLPISLISNIKMKALCRDFLEDPHSKSSLEPDFQTFLRGSRGQENLRLKTSIHDEIFVTGMNPHVLLEEVG